MNQNRGHSEYWGEALAKNVGTMCNTIQGLVC